MLPAALLLAGCIDNTLAPAKDDAPNDTAGGTDTAPPGDITVEAGCTPPAADWAIRQRWAWAPPDDGHGLWFPHIGRFEDADSDGVVSLADPMGIWMTATIGGTEADYLVDATGRTAWELPVAEDAFSIATIGDVEPSRFGMEYLTAKFDPHVDDSLSAYGEQTLLWRSDIANARDGLLSLADLEADGTPDLLAVSYAASATDGSVEFTFAGEGTGDASGDLDLDGYPEILTISDSQPRVYDHRGALLATCPVSVSPNNALFAMGNLDEDDAGEFAVASPDGVAVCDTDGSLLASASPPSSLITTLALAELDGDPLPEVLLDVHPQDGTPPLVAALDTDLTPIWTHTLPADQAQLPFSVADLDGDGRHEVLLATTHALEILGPDGRLLTTATGPDYAQYGQPPMVVDLDGDGLAEIVLSGGGEEFLAAYDNPEGGWRVLGARPSAQTTAPTSRPTSSSPTSAPHPPPSPPRSSSSTAGPGTPSDRPPSPRRSTPGSRSA